MVKVTGIYKITSPSRYVYIGQSVDVNKRFKAYEKLDCKKQPAIYKSLIKHGSRKHKFEIIVTCDVSELNEKERYFQDLYDATGRLGLNCRLTVSTDRSGYFSQESRQKMMNSRKGIALSEEHKKNLSISHKGKKLSEEHKLSLKKSSRHLKHSMETKDILRAKNLGKKMSEESKNKMSAAAKGRKASEETKLKLSKIRQGLNHPMFGKNHTEVTLEKMRKSKIGFSHNKETKEKMSNSKNGLRPNNARIILDIESGVFYYSSKEVSDLYGYGQYTLINKLNNVRYNNTRFIYV